MGKWNNRWIPNSRSYNRYDNRGKLQRELPPPYPAEPVGNSVPEWEKQFCYAVGSVPWRKVLSTKTFTSCYPGVMNWDDSEAKDTFHAAKKRFWAQMNGLRTDDVPLPDPNAYIDQIDWNASIDTDLYINLDRALLPYNANTKQETEVVTAGVVDMSALNSRWQERHHGTAEDVWDSGEGWEKSNAGGWGNLDNGTWGPVNTAIQDKPEITKVSADPWGCVQDKTDRPLNKNGAWGHCNDKSQGWEQHEQLNSNSFLNPRGGNFQGRGASNDIQWKLPGNDSWCRNQQPDNSKETSDWLTSSIQHNKASAAREWGNNRNQQQFRNSWNNNQHKKTNNYYKSTQDQDWNRGARKRDSPSTNNYAPRSKSPGFQRINNQRHDQYEQAQFWRNRQSTTQQAGSSFRPI